VFHALATSGRWVRSSLAANKSNLCESARNGGAGGAGRGRKRGG
jgi:hypothetical protein